jgi:hypothetical protein
MTVSAKLSKDGKTLVVHVPMSFRKRGGRKLIVVPDGASWAPQRARVDGPMVRALARAHGWKRLLENGQFGSIAELAEAEKINPSYIFRLLRLTLLAPTIVVAILDGTQPRSLQLDDLIQLPFPDWERQRVHFAAKGTASG